MARHFWGLFGKWGKPEIIIGVVGVFVTVAAIFVAHRDSSRPTQPNESRAEVPQLEGKRTWQIVDIRDRSANIKRNNWRDVTWIGDEAWLCSADSESGGQGSIGSGTLMHSANEVTWDEFDQTRIDAGRGTFSLGAGQDRYDWHTIGPMYSIYPYNRLLSPGRFEYEAWLVASAGVFGTSDSGKTWRRVTPLPDSGHSRAAYAMFTDLAGLEGYSEIYAVGWTGISHWSNSRNSWEIQLPTNGNFPINAIDAVGSQHRVVFAVGREGPDSDTHGAIYEYNTQDSQWQHVPLPGITFLPRQSLKGVLVASPELVFAVGEGGLVIRGTLAENSDWQWERLADVPTTADLEAITKYAGKVWVVGDKGVVLETGDEGKHWELSRVKDSEGNFPELWRVRYTRDEIWVVGLGVVAKSKVQRSEISGRPAATGSRGGS